MLSLSCMLIFSVSPAQGIPDRNNQTSDGVLYCCDVLYNRSSQKYYARYNNFRYARRVLQEEIFSAIAHACKVL